MRPVNAVKSVHRQWMILKFLSRSAEGKTTDEILDHLTSEDVSQQLRTIQRDLAFLSEIFHIENERNGHEVRWRWMPGSSGALMPGLSFSDCLSLLLVESSIKPLLPVQLLKRLQPQFALAKQTLSQSSLFANWSEKFASAAPELSNIPPLIDEKVLERVQNAVLRQQQLEIRYQAINHSAPRQYHLAPLALVQRGQVLYLIATVEGYSDIRRFAMHRMSSAELLGMNNPITDFSLKAYLAAGGMQFASDDAAGSIQLKARVRKQQASFIAEQPIAEDMELTPIDDDWYRLEATVSDSWQLRWWIMSHAADIEVLEPENLRANVSKQLENALALYS